MRPRHGSRLHARGRTANRHAGFELTISGGRLPATPLAWAESLAKGIKGSRVLTSDGDGHIAYLRNACAKASIDRCLVSGTLPAPGTICR
ncbi:alpha/beta hydrolase [Nonomuraea sp. NPDC049028]|uniref:alpha/beta hydrolase n=1 Tax=Nonomuraea sp. NPDC049028 TaxID=3364348 RepID=UPI003718DFCC